MTFQTLHSHIALAALVVLLLSVSSPLYALGTILTTAPGSAFHNLPYQQEVYDQISNRAPSEQSFWIKREHSNSHHYISGEIQIPRGSSLLHKIVIHFKTGHDTRLERIFVSNKEPPDNSYFHAYLYRSDETSAKGDYDTVEFLNKGNFTNAWGFEPPISVRAPLFVIMQFEYEYLDILLLTRVETEFTSNLITQTFATNDISRVAGIGVPSEPVGKGVTPPVLSVPANQVIYALGNDNELLWYGHSGREDGTFRWAAAQAKTVGSGWAFKQVFSGGDGVIYAVTTDGDLLWYRHEGHADGSFRWTFSDGKKVNTGWNFARVFSGGGGVIYALTATGDLLWFRHDGHVDGSDRWTNREGTWIAGDWTYKQVFSGGDGIIYAVSSDNRLLWFRHDGRDDGGVTWAASEGKTVGTGWDFKHIFSAGDGIIYAINDSSQLLWYRHDGRDNGSAKWAAPQGKLVGTGWSVKDIFSGVSP